MSAVLNQCSGNDTGLPRTCFAPAVSLTCYRSVLAAVSSEKNSSIFLVQKLCG